MLEVRTRYKQGYTYKMDKEIEQHLDTNLSKLSDGKNFKIITIKIFT